LTSIFAEGLPYMAGLDADARFAASWHQPNSQGAGAVAAGDSQGVGAAGDSQASLGGIGGDGGGDGGIAGVGSVGGVGGGSVVGGGGGGDAETYV
jgi:hypothetical protein